MPSVETPLVMVILAGFRLELKGSSVARGYCFRNVRRSVAAWCTTRVRRPAERLLRPGRPVSDPVGVLDSRRQRRGGVERGRPGEGG